MCNNMLWRGQMKLFILGNGFAKARAWDEQVGIFSHVFRFHTSLMFNRYGQGEARAQDYIVCMKINEKLLLGLVNTKLAFMTEKSEVLDVTSVKPLFIYLHNLLNEGDFDINFEFVAELELSGSKPTVYRICCWYSRTRNVLCPKALVLPSNISYVKVKVGGKDCMYGGYVLNEQLEAILKEDDVSKRDTLWRIARKVTKEYGETDSPLQCEIYDSDMKKRSIISF